nr:hypothetical protein [Tanacetum cinerariifolium]
TYGIRVAEVLKYNVFILDSRVGACGYEFVRQLEPVVTSLIQIESHKSPTMSLLDVGNQFAGAVSAIPGIVQRYMDQRMNEAVKVAVQIQSDCLYTYIETVTLKRRRDDDADKDEEPSDGPDRGSKRRREGKDPESAKTVTLKRRRDDDADKDEEPSAGPDRGSKRRREGKEPESASAPMETATRSAGSIQPWISELAKQSDSRSSFNELMDTPLDFFNFLINRHTLTIELLGGPTYERMKGSCKSLVELEYHLEEVFKATTDQLDRVNPEGQQGASSRKYTTSITKTKAADYEHIKWIEDLVPRTMWIEERIGYDKHALWGVSHWGRKRQQFYGFARRVEDLQLGVESYQKKLNLTKPDSYRSDLKRKEAYTAYYNPRGFIYQNKDKRNRLMRIDEIHKFSDGTLTDVRTTLDDRLKGIRMQYLPQSIWRKSDKDRAAAMIQAMDKRLKTRRIMRSLERFVGGRLYEGDFRMLQRTI